RAGAALAETAESEISRDGLPGQQTEISAELQVPRQQVRSGHFEVVRAIDSGEPRRVDERIRRRDARRVGAVEGAAIDLRPRERVAGHHRPVVAVSLGYAELDAVVALIETVVVSLLRLRRDVRKVLVVQRDRLVVRRATLAIAAG